VAGPIVHNWGMPTLASLTGFLIIVAVVVLLPRVRDISTRWRLCSAAPLLPGWKWW